MFLTVGEYLEHHGVSGQKWYRRRWQNYDGSLTPAGYDHYGYGKPNKSSKNPWHSNKPSNDSGKANKSSNDSGHSNDTIKTNAARGSLRDYSDNELRREIDRTKLEREYQREVGNSGKYYDNLKKKKVNDLNDEELSLLYYRKLEEKKMADLDRSNIESGMRTVGSIIETLDKGAKLVNRVHSIFDDDDKKKNNNNNNKNNNNNNNRNNSNN